MLCSSASTVIFSSLQCCLHFTSDIRMKNFFFRWASQNIQYQIPAAANERSKRLTPYGNGAEPTVHVKLLPQTCSEVQSLLGNFVTLQKIWILNFLQCTEFQHWLSQQNECLLAFTPCWMQALNPMNQKCCDSALSREKKGLTLLGFCFLARQCFEEYLCLQSCTGLFSAWKLMWLTDHK